MTILGYSAMAGTIGGGGLGQIAITYGYQKYDDQIVWLCVALTIIIVQILQEFGMYIARRTDRARPAPDRRHRSCIYIIPRCCA